MRSCHTDEERRVVTAVLEWLRVRGAADPNYGATWLGKLDVDASHSALLERLLSGKPALPQPPPVAMSYPWYGLIDEGEAVILDTHVHFQGTPEAGTWEHQATGGLPAVIIEQSFWRVLEQVSETEYVVQYYTGAPTCRMKLSEHDYPGIDAEHNPTVYRWPAWHLQVLPNAAPSVRSE